MRAGRGAGAASVLLLASGADHDGVLHRALAGGIEGAHVEDVDALHLTEDLETLETGSLLEVGRDGAGLGTRTEKVVLGANLCKSSSAYFLRAIFPEFLFVVFRGCRMTRFGSVGAEI